MVHLVQQEAVQVDEIARELDGGDLPPAVMAGPMMQALLTAYHKSPGAVEQAHNAISRAESETTAYEERLRAAKAAIFQARDQKLKQWNAEREAALEQIRRHTQERVRGARQEIEQSAQEARLQIVTSSDELSSRILNAVLPPGVHPTEVAP